MSEEKTLTEKEFKAANPGKDKRHYKKYKKELRIRLRMEQKEVGNMGIAEKLATVPQAIAEHMKPAKVKAVPFSLDAFDARQLEYFANVEKNLNGAMGLTRDIPNGAFIAKCILDGLENVWFLQAEVAEVVAAVRQNVKVADAVIAEAKKDDAAIEENGREVDLLVKTAKARKAEIMQKSEVA